MIAQRDTSGREFVIRTARSDDAAGVGAILAELAGEDGFILLSPEEVVLDNLQRGEELARAGRISDRWHVAVAEQEGAVAGMLDLRVVPLRKCAHVMELGIGLRSFARDRGIGKALMEYGIRKASILGYRKIRLFVIDGNDRAIHLYRETGFVETGRYHDEVRVGEGLRDLVVMERGLP